MNTPGLNRYRRQSGGRVGSRAGSRVVGVGAFHTAGGFTLAELLVVIGIIAVLISILLPSLGAARKQARAARELAALRQILTAYQAYTGENRGNLLPGYYNAGLQTDGRGNDVTFPASARYPWRLAPYLNYTVLGTLLLNEQEAEVGDNYSAPPGHQYMVSLYPSFGLNSIFVGGNYVSGPLIASPAATKLYGQFYAQKITDVRDPTALLVFASARYHGSDGTQQGYFDLEPPYLTNHRWADQYSDSDDSSLFGFVHPRHPGKRAAAGFLDGHAELLGTDELQDMRHWSPQATRKDWILGSP